MALVGSSVIWKPFGSMTCELNGVKLNAGYAVL